MSAIPVTTLAAVLPSGRKRVALGLVAVAMGFSACGSGGEGTIPPDDADALTAQVDDVEEAVDNGLCSVAQTEIQQLIGKVNALPADVGVKTKDELRRLSENLSELNETDCEEVDSGGTGATISGVLGEEPGGEGDDG